LNNCVDGFCCNNACAGACSACSAALSGGTNGTCGNIPAYSDPSNECSTSPLYNCNGSGACANVCDADADCPAAFYCTGTPGTCAADLVQGAACTKDAQCPSG